MRYKLSNILCDKIINGKEAVSCVYFPVLGFLSRATFGLASEVLATF